MRKCDRLWPRKDRTPEEIISAELRCLLSEGYGDKELVYVRPAVQPINNLPKLNPANLPRKSASEAELFYEDVVGQQYHEI